MDMSSQLQARAALTLGKKLHWIRSWVDPGAGMESNSDSSEVQAVA
jgi:hypothetical protein